MCSQPPVLNMTCPSFRNNGTCALISEESLGCNTSYHSYEKRFLKVFCVDDKE